MPLIPHATGVLIKVEIKIYLYGCRSPSHLMRQCIKAWAQGSLIWLSPCQVNFELRPKYSKTTVDKHEEFFLDVQSNLRGRASD